MLVNENIKELVEDRGTTIKWLSSKTGINYWKLLDILKGEVDPRVTECEKIADAFGIEVKMLFKKR